MSLQASENELNVFAKNDGMQDSAGVKATANSDSSSHILSQLRFLACNTKAQAANTEKVQCRMARAVETIERQQKENQVQTAPIT